MTVSLPTVDELVALYSQNRDSDIGQAEYRLHQQFGVEPLMPMMALVFPQIRRSNGRSFILFGLNRYARLRQDVVSLARSALSDRAYLVRAEACSILAYSLREDMIHPLEALLAHPHPQTRADAAAAIDAITSKNHHFYVDRKHTGSTFWGVNPGDMPRL